MLTPAGTVAGIANEKLCVSEEKFAPIGLDHLLERQHSLSFPQRVDTHWIETPIGQMVSQFEVGSSLFNFCIRRCVLLPEPLIALIGQLTNPRKSPN